MKLHELSPAKGSRKAPKRLGRGVASGSGKTAGRGTKGRSGQAEIFSPRSRPRWRDKRS